MEAERTVSASSSISSLNIGSTQHFAVVDGDCRAELEAFAEIMGFEFYNIK